MQTGSRAQPRANAHAQPQANAHAHALMLTPVSTQTFTRSYLYSPNSQYATLQDFAVVNSKLDMIMQQFALLQRPAAEEHPKVGSGGGGGEVSDREDDRLPHILSANSEILLSTEGPRERRAWDGSEQEMSRANAPQEPRDPDRNAATRRREFSVGLGEKGQVGMRRVEPVTLSISPGAKPISPWRSPSTKAAGGWTETPPASSLPAAASISRDQARDSSGAQTGVQRRRGGLHFDDASVVQDESGNLEDRTSDLRTSAAGTCSSRTAAVGGGMHQSRVENASAHPTAGEPLRTQSHETNDEEDNSDGSDDVDLNDLQTPVFVGGEDGAGGGRARRDSGTSGSGHAESHVFGEHQNAKAPAPPAASAAWAHALAGSPPGRHDEAAATAPGGSAWDAGSGSLLRGQGAGGGEGKGDSVSGGRSVSENRTVERRLVPLPPSQGVRERETVRESARVGEEAQAVGSSQQSQQRQRRRVTAVSVGALS